MMTDLVHTLPNAGPANPASAAPSPSPNVDAQARAAAESFESFFLAQVFQNMFAGLPNDGPFGGGPSEGIYRSLLHGEYAKVITNAGGVGIADAVYREILKLQETTSS